MSKSLWQSKTFWVNAITAAAAVLTTLVDTPVIADNPKIVGVIVTTLSVVNIVLRLITSQPIQVQ